MTKIDGFRAYLGYKTVVIKTRLQGTVSLMKEMSGNTTALIECAFCINQAIFYSRINDVGHASEEVLLEY
jgi:hypothetical protein